ncbi:HNH endonuclease signature motif containing protein [Nocardioides seonyuensis]|uniref:HNH endonuclease signature motif containing protein n=1 Tax=Nocardioides seonyuensis TaxID=2518371 RepID=UPI0014214A75|nr:HNH endonuclease signature motif containing protein [Nocardioides seonyuensis]
MSISASDPQHGWRAPGTELVASPHVARVLARVGEALDELGSLPLGALSDPDVTRVLEAATSAVGRVTAQACRVSAEADRRRLGDEIGARHTHQWWARRTRLTRGEAARLVRLGKRLEEDLHLPVGEALAAGSLRVDQAQVIVAAVDAIPDEVETPDGQVRHIDADIRAQARDHLLKIAAEHDAKVLRRVGKRILDVVAPEVGEALEQQLLEKETQNAAATAFLKLHDDGHGKTWGRFALPTHQGAALRLALHAIANPARHDHDELKDAKTEEWRPTPQRLGQAFGEFIERYPADQLPQSAGVNATVVVTLDLKALHTGLGVATLGNGDRISASTARRLACEAGIIPLVLGGKSMPLDVGRSKRFHTKYQRIALTVRDKGCTAEGCDMPPDACHAHHDLEWTADHGPTNVDTGRLLCPHHHRRAHDKRYETRTGPDNKVSFHRRT